MAIIVQKFGGTSVADAEKIRSAAQKAARAHDQGNQVVIVASARGKQTDQLMADAMELNPNPPERELDQLLSTGEQQTVSLIAMALEHMDYRAISLTGAQIKMRTDGAYTKARIESIGAQEIHKYLDQGRIVVIAGFQGVDLKGNVTTLGRGGSDTTAVAIAAALGAHQCEIYTDVDAIYTTDPRIFKDAARLEEISYDEMLELASLGAGVLHSRAVEFGKKYDVTIHLRSSIEDKPGTIITHEVPKMEGVVVSGATVQKDMAKISLIDVDNKPGNAAKIFQHLAGAKVVVNDIVQTEVNQNKANLSFTVASADLKAAQKAVEQIKESIGCGDIFVRDDIAEISAVGVGMRSHYGVAEKMFGTLAENQINIDSITTSEIRMSCLVDRDQADKALEAVCRAFELDKPVDERSG